MPDYSGEFAACTNFSLSYALAHKNEPNVGPRGNANWSVAS